MKGLKVLNLSHTNIKKLPDSVSDLENLSALLLHGCWNLSYVPSLIRLKKLKELDMHHSGIKELPEGFDMLSNLQCLDLSQIKDLCTPPLSGVLSRFSYLQILKLSQAIKGKDLIGLKHLEIAQCWLVFDMSDWRMFNESRHQWKLKSYKFFLRKTNHQQFEHKHVESMHHNISSSFDRIMLISNCSFNRGKEAMIPANIQFLGINECDFRVRGLSDAFPYFHNATELKVCEIKNCEGLEYIWSPTPSAPVTTPCTFSHFRKLHIRSCFKIKKLFPHVLLQQQLFPNLQEIKLVNCPYMTEIISYTEDEGAKRGSKDSLLSLPNLKVISLLNMPNLESICRGLLLCDSQIKLSKEGCPMLKMIPLSLPLLCDSSECTLRRLPTHIEWWASLDKTYPKDVKVLRHLLIKRSIL